MSVFGCQTRQGKEQARRHEKRGREVSTIAPAPGKAGGRAAAERKEAAEEYEDIALYIAGIHNPREKSPSEVDCRFVELEKNIHWKEYSVLADSSWARLERRQLARIRSWAKQELAPHCSEQTSLFYPFSGPDFLYAYCFFQNLDDYVLIGLEPVGRIPEPENIPPDSLGSYFRALRVALGDILTISFFKTKDMEADFASERLEGTLPILLVFLARTGNRIIAIEPVQIGKNGEVTRSTFSEVAKYDAGKMNGVKITFERNGLQKTLYYFSIDLSNSSLNGKIGLRKFIDDRGEMVTLVKAATYLMHKKYFSEIRAIILDRSRIILQDDSGIPLRCFDNENWRLQLYGFYSCPIPLFKEWVQDDLRVLYQDSSRVAPLPFGVGYTWQANGSNLMLALRNGR